MKKNLFIFVLLAFPLFSYSQKVVGKMFPSMETETHDDKVINLPEAGKGKYTLVGLAYSKKSEDDLNTWFNPIYQAFIHKSEKPSMFSSWAYDVNVYFVPMFTGVKASASSTAKKQASENVDPKLLPHLLFYKGDLKTYKDALGFDKKDVPYFFVLDQEGKIVYATTGAYTEEKMDDIETIVAE